MFYIKRYNIYYIFYYYSSYHKINFKKSINFCLAFFVVDRWKSQKHDRNHSLKRNGALKCIYVYVSG